MVVFTSVYLCRMSSSNLDFQEILLKCRCLLYVSAIMLWLWESHRNIELSIWNSSKTMRICMCCVYRTGGEGSGTADLLAWVCWEGVHWWLPSTFLAPTHQVAVNSIYVLFSTLLGIMYIIFLNAHGMASLLSGTLSWWVCLAAHTVQTDMIVFKSIDRILLAVWKLYRFCLLWKLQMLTWLCFPIWDIT